MRVKVDWSTSYLLIPIWLAFGGLPFCSRACLLEAVIENVSQYDDFGFFVNRSCEKDFKDQKNAFSQDFPCESIRTVDFLGNLQALSSPPFCTAAMNPLLLVDIGNSALKFVSYNPNQRSFCSSTHRAGWSEDTEFDCPALRNAAIDCDHILVSSVNRRHSQSVFQELLKATSVRPIEITRHHVPIRMNVDFPDQVGIDRVLAAFAAWTLFGSNAESVKPLIVLQIGTAVTIDVVDRDGVYQGGVILPSETTLYSSLAEKTDRLPRIEVDDSRFSIDLAEPGTILTEEDPNRNQFKTHPAGKNTIDAVKKGVTNCMLGGVEWTYQSYCREFGNELSILATGGGASQLHSTSLPITIVSNLVLKALSMISESIA